MKRFPLFFFSFILFFIGCGNIISQTLTPIKWEFSYKETTDSTGELIIKANIEPNWHIYSQLQNGDGPLPTVFKFVKTVDYDLIGSVTEPDPERKYSDVFGADIAQFTREAIFIQKINRNIKKEFVVMGEVECMACNDIQCLPPKTYKFTIKIPQNELK